MQWVFIHATKLYEKQRFNLIPWEVALGRGLPVFIKII